MLATEKFFVCTIRDAYLCEEQWLAEGKIPQIGKKNSENEQNEVYSDNCLSNRRGSDSRR